MFESEEALQEISKREVRHAAAESALHDQISDVAKLIRTVSAKRFVAEVSSQHLPTGNEEPFHVTAEELTDLEQQLGQAVETAIQTGVAVYHRKFEVEQARQPVADAIVNEM